MLTCTHCVVNAMAAPCARSGVKPSIRRHRSVNGVSLVIAELRAQALPAGHPPPLTAYSLALSRTTLLLFARKAKINFSRCELFNTELLPLSLLC